MSEAPTERRAWQPGQGSISTVPPEDNGAGGGGGGAGKASGEPPDEPACGIWNCEAHFGHLPDLPALLSSTEYDAPQPGQAKRIIEPS